MKSNPKAYNHQIHQGEMKDKMLWAAREKDQVTHKGKPIRLRAEPYKPEESGANIQHPQRKEPLT